MILNEGLNKIRDLVNTALTKGQNGTGTSTTISGIPVGTYTYTVANASGTSPASGNVVINTQPATPAAPAVGTITQPTVTTATGSTGDIEFSRADGSGTADPTQLVLIKNLDTGEGAGIEELIEKSPLEQTEELLERMMKNGDVFQNMPGRVKVL